MFKDVSLFFEARDWLLSNCECPPDEPEMTAFESAFLCGLIKERKPHKIVEVGVAAGGTTAIMLKCIEMLDMVKITEIHSVDLSEHFYRGTGESSGYLAEGILHREDISFQHKFHLGNLLPEVIDEIGKDIDFLILDTAHVLPGELLDFLTAFPYLSSGACVVLHDIANNHYFESPASYATQVLFSTVVADKILSKDKNRQFEYPNIGAFIINEDTKRYISDIFNALAITWSYSLNQSQIETYSHCFKMHYNPEMVDLFLHICSLQENTLALQEENIRHRYMKQQEAYESSYTWRIGKIIMWLPSRIKRLFLLRKSSL